MRLADIDVSPAIIEQLSHEPEESYWFVWDRETDRPWRGGRTGLIRAFAFESDAAYVAETGNGNRSPHGRILDGYPRQATVKEAKSAWQEERPVGLFDRDRNLIRRLG